MAGAEREEGRRDLADPRCLPDELQTSVGLLLHSPAAGMLEGRSDPPAAEPQQGGGKPFLGGMGVLWNPARP